MTQNAKTYFFLQNRKKRKMEMFAFCVISILELFLKKSQDYLVKVTLPNKSQINHQTCVSCFTKEARILLCIPGSPLYPNVPKGLGLGCAIVE